MFGASQLTDDIVASAAGRSHDDIVPNDDVARIVETIAPQVRLMVTARLSPKPNQYHAIDDIFQQAMLAISTGLTRLENRTVAGLKAYTSRIVANKVADYLRAPAAKASPRNARINSLDSVVAGYSESAPLWQFLSDGGASPLSAVAQHDEVNRIMAELGNLREQEREIITLAFFDQFSTAEIADRMGISRPAASMRLIRAVETLLQNVTGSSGATGTSDATGASDVTGTSGGGES